jgi:hypothetical protein
VEFRATAFNLGIYFIMNISNKQSEFDRFANLVDKVLSVPKADIDRRMPEYLKSLPKPIRPGRKPRAVHPAKP